MSVPSRPTQPPFAWADRFFTFGVTGTNGKTSTTHLIAAISAAAEPPTPVLALSTIGYELAGRELGLPHTERGFFEAFARAAKLGCRYAAVECTSKALAGGYAHRWRFDLGVFTNLSPDHLATHGTWEHYLAAKAQLFVHLGPGRTAVLNAADPHTSFLDQAMPADVQRRFYGVPSRGPLLHRADLAAQHVKVTASGTEIELSPSPWAERLGGHLRMQMVGQVFAENGLAAAAAALAAGLPPEAVVRGLAECACLAGRFEVVCQAPVCVIDYAHSPDALARTCDQARVVAKRHDAQLIVVFGAGGQSSPDKRGPMGQAVGARADVAIVTNDNPRAEDPRNIADAVLAGVRQGGRAHGVIELDRGRAIERAVSSAARDDVIVIAGKGHETTQEVAGEILPFSDREHVLAVLGQER